MENKLSKEHKDAVFAVYRLIFQRQIYSQLKNNNNLTEQEENKYKTINIHYESRSFECLNFFGYNNGSYIDYIALILNTTKELVLCSLKYLFDNHFIICVTSTTNDYTIFKTTEVTDEQYKQLFNA